MARCFMNDKTVNNPKVVLGVQNGETDRGLARIIPSKPGRNGLFGVVRAEMALGFRKSQIPFLTAGLLVFCQALIPPIDAPYAALTANDLKPIMSADTMTLATGTIFATLAFPAFVLYLGGSRSRDAETGAEALLLSSAVSTPRHALAIAGGRLLANGILATVILGIASALLLISVFFRTGQLPALISVSSTLGIAFPIVLLSSILGVALDAAVLSNRMKSLVAFASWTALLLLTLFGRGADFFGLRFLGENMIPGPTPPALAVGFIGGKMGTISWNEFHETGAHFGIRLLLTSVVAGIGLSAAFAMAGAFRRQLALRSGVQTGLPPAIQAGTRRRVKEVQATTTDLPERLAPRSVPRLRMLWVIAGSWLLHGAWPKILILLAAVLAGASSATAEAGAAASLLIPALIFTQAKQRTAAGARTLKLSTASFWNPTPHLMETFALWGLTFAPMLPWVAREIFSGAGLLHPLHFAVAALACCGWIVYAQRALEKDLLATSIYLFIWYLLACNRLPPAADLLAVHGTAPVSFAVTAAIGACLCLAIARKDLPRGEKNEKRQ